MTKEERNKCKQLLLNRAHTMELLKKAGIKIGNNCWIGSKVTILDGVEIGDGFASAMLSGEDNADEMRRGADGKPVFLSNHAGGILGGISSGQPIVCRFAVKPTSSILSSRRKLGSPTQSWWRSRAAASRADPHAAVACC